MRMMSYQIENINKDIEIIFKKQANSILELKCIIIEMRNLSRES